MIKNILEITYKCAVLALLSAAVFLLYDIRSHQQTFPTIGDVKNAGGKFPAMIRMRPEIEAQMPLIFVPGGSLCVNGSVSIDR